MKNLTHVFETKVSQAWQHNENEKISAASAEFQKLLQNAEFHSHLTAQFSTMCGGQIELLRSQEHGFILTAYAEKQDVYRQPHNHGNGWVIYGVIGGQMEMHTYELANGLAVKEADMLYSNDFKVYLQGQIHDTKGIAKKSIVLRFTSCDLKKEESEGRMKRFDPPVNLQPAT